MHKSGEQQKEGKGMLNNILIFLLIWIMGFFILAGVLYFISRHNLWFRKYGLTLFLGLLVMGFTVYFTGYFFGNISGGSSLIHAIGSAFLALFSSGRIMVMELDIGETGSLYMNELYRMIYGIVMFAAMVMLAAMVLANVGGGIIGRIRLIFVKTVGTGKNLYFFYGLNRDTVELVADIHRKDPCGILFLLSIRDEEYREEKDRRDLENEAFQSGAFKVVFNPGKSLHFIVRAAEKCKGETHVLCMKQERWKNESLIRALCGEAEITDRLHLYAFYETEKSRKISEDEVFRKLDVHWTQPEELSARGLLLSSDFLKIFPDDRCVEGRIDGELRLALAGYTAANEVLCRYLICGVQAAGLRLRIQFLGTAEEMQKETAFFFQANPMLSLAAEMELTGIEPGTVDYYRYLLDEKECPHAVFFIGKDMDENVQFVLRTAEFLQRNGKNRTLFVKAESTGMERCVLERAGAVAFGCREQVCSYDVLIGEKLDAIAKSVHMYYQRFYGVDGDVHTLWRKAGVYEKMSSRALALHIQWKARCAGFDLTPGTPDGSYERMTASDGKLTENLSIGEHRRWQAYLVTEGWKNAKPEELPAGKNKDALTRQHACLVPWEKLPEVSGFYGIDYQYLDRILICSLEKITGEAGYALKRRRSENESG